MSTNANYAATPKCSIGLLTTANTARDGSGAIVPIFTAGTNGSRIDDIQIKATGSSTTSGLIRLYISDGTNSRLITEIPVNAVTPSDTTPSFETGITLGEVLQNGYSLRASTTKGDLFNVIAFGGDF